MAVKPIPEGYHTVTPYIMTSDVEVFLGFLKQAFAGEVTECLKTEKGEINHAEVRIGDSMVMVSPGKGNFQPMPAMFYLYMPDTDAAYERAIQAGATSVMEPADMFYGDRNAGVQDKFGNYWWIATHIEDVSPEELERRNRENRS